MKEKEGGRDREKKEGKEREGRRRKGGREKGRERGGRRERESDVNLFQLKTYLKKKLTKQSKSSGY